MVVDLQSGTELEAETSEDVHPGQHQQRGTVDLLPDREPKSGHGPGTEVRSRSWEDNDELSDMSALSDDPGATGYEHNNTREKGGDDLKVVCRLALAIWSYWYGCRERIFLNISKASNPLETP